VFTNDELERLDAVLAGSPLALIAWDDDRRISFWASTARRLFGYAPGETMGKRIEDLRFVAEHDVPVVDETARTLRGGAAAIRSVRVRNRRRDGTLVRCAWYNMLVPDDPAHRVISLVEDVTEAERMREELVESEERLRSLFELNPTPIVELDREGRIRALNPAAIATAGLPREALIGLQYNRFVHPEDEARIRAEFERALSGVPVGYFTKALAPDGRVLHFQVVLVPQVKGGEVTGVYSIIQDVTRERAAERLAAARAQRLRDLYDIAAGGADHDRLLAAIELGQRVLEARCGALVRLQGDDAVLERYACPGVLDDDHYRLLIAAARRAAAAPERGAHVDDASLVAPVRVGGEIYGALVFLDALLAQHVDESDLDFLSLLTVLVESLLERRRARERLQMLAYISPLTMLPNRVALHERIAEAIAAARALSSRFAVLLLDLDRFKDVNDSLGHTLGDRLLREAAERLRSVVAERGVVAHVGADEFAIVLPTPSDRSEAKAIAERIVAEFSAPFRLGDYQQFVSTSIGIAIFPDDGETPETLLKNADIAMYRAKEGGRGAYEFYDPVFEAPIHLRLSQEKFLRDALDRDELIVHYQPLLDLRSGTVVGVEALVRWEHPVSGFIEPDLFIPSAEASGLIVPLGEWVLRAATREMREFQRRFGPLRLSVNLSARQFYQRDLCERILSILDAAGFDPHLLELEITESVAMSDAAHTIATLRAFKEAGLRTAVDDFGTGYSSLAYLHRFGPDTIKIDRSFIDGIGRESESEIIVSTIITMAHGLGVGVVAEGVETDAQREWLRARECDAMQGYVLAPPLSAEELEAFLRDRTGRAAPTP